MSSDSHLSFRCRMFILSMITFGCNQNPSISFKQFDDFYDLLCFHYYEFYEAKVIKRILFSKYY